MAKDAARPDAFCSSSPSLNLSLNLNDNNGHLNQIMKLYTELFKVTPDLRFYIVNLYGFVLDNNKRKISKLILSDYTFL